MQLNSITDLHMTDYNMASGKGIFDVDNCQREAELFFYLQGQECLGIRLGRHDKSVATTALEEYLILHKTEIRRQIKPEIQGLREEGRQTLISLAI
ncbi:MAG: hypothetical protein GXY49_05745 [Syntrophomonadaceae bacterium]|nr:hypothetical protein [Syntrophomonadaceae bacterium]